MISLATSTCIVLCLSIIGRQIVMILWPSAGRAIRLGLAYPLGAGLFSTLLFVASLVGMALNRLTVLTLFSLFASTLLVLEARSKVSAQTSSSSRSQVGFRAIGLVGGALWFLLAVFLSLGRAYSTYDAFAGWALKGYGIFLEGTINAAARWGTWGLAYPLNMPMQIGLHWLFGAETLPGSKLIFPVFLLSLALVCVSFHQSVGVSQRTALIGGAFIVTNPLIFLHGTVGFQNLPFGFYLASAVFVSILGFSHNDEKTLCLAGLLFSLAVWTRAEGILFCLASMLVISLAFKRSFHQPKHLLVWALPVAIISLIWFGFARQGISDSHLGVAMRAVFPAMVQGQFDLPALVKVPGLFMLRAVSPANWGLFVPAMALLLVISLRVNRGKWDPTSKALAYSSIVIAAIPNGLFYVRSFSRAEGFNDLLVRSFDRAFIPAAIVLMVAWLAIAARDRKRAPYP